MWNLRKPYIHFSQPPLLTSFYPTLWFSCPALTIVALFLSQSKQSFFPLESLCFLFLLFETAHPKEFSGLFFFIICVLNSNVPFSLRKSWYMYLSPLTSPLLYWHNFHIYFSNYPYKYIILYICLNMYLFTKFLFSLCSNFH